MAMEFAQIIGPLAQEFFGEPNRLYSSEYELRYGSKGSLSIDLRKGTWYDHEADEGGGALDLVTRETKLVGSERLDWLKRRGYAFDTVQSNGAMPHPTIVATYDYTDEGGNVLSQVCRFEPKDFRQRRPDGAHGWVWSVKGVRHVPYRLPQILDNDNKVLVIVEGEKAADKLWKLGVPATCSAGGAGKWREELNEYFRGADVVIIPDHDPQKRHPKTNEPLFHPDGRPILPGQDHAQTVAKALSGVANRVRVLELWQSWPEMPWKADVYDWVTAGGTAEQLYALIEKLPVWSTQDATVKTVPLLFPFPIEGKTIPRRQWVVPGLLLRRNVSILVAPPGSGKSLLTLQMALMMCTGMAWGGWRPRKACKVLVINSEDDSDEMRRRLYAACEEMQITTYAELRERLAIAGAPGDIVIAKADSRTHTVVEQPIFKQLVKTVLDGKFDVLVVDPFAETFEGDENSNSELKWAAVLWRRVARETGAAVMLVHHTRKFGAEAGNMDSARGGSSLVGVARIVSTLFAMTKEEAEIYEVEEEERHKFLRFDDAKANQALVTFAAKWFTKKSVTLPNGDDDEPPDEVGVLVPWEPQGIFARLTNEIANRICDAITTGMLGKDGKPDGNWYCATKRGSSNRRWGGNVIMQAIQCKPTEAQKVIDTWLKSGLLIEVEAIIPLSKGKEQKCLRVVDMMRPGTVVSEDRI